MRWIICTYLVLAAAIISAWLLTEGPAYPPDDAALIDANIDPPASEPHEQSKRADVVIPNESCEDVGEERGASFDDVGASSIVDHQRLRERFASNGTIQRILSRYGAQLTTEAAVDLAERIALAQAEREELVELGTLSIPESWEHYDERVDDICRRYVGDSFPGLAALRTEIGR